MFIYYILKYCHSRAFTVMFFLFPLYTYTVYTYTSIFSLDQLPISYPSYLNNSQTSHLFSYLLTEALDLIAKDPHTRFPATVHLSHALSPEEKAYCLKRKRYAHKALERFFNTTLNPKHIPTIAVCASGGGLRAMFATLGFLSGLEQLGLLDAISYISSLSGSTFAISSWMAHKSSIHDIKDRLSSEFEQIFTTNFKITEVLKTGVMRLLYEQKLSPVNLFGALIANRIFSAFQRDAYHLRLSDSVGILSEGQFPLPIYTAISIPQPELPEFTWFEFNPYEIRYKQGIFDVHMPSWSFGRFFARGISQDQAPEYSLAFIIGICGSAFTISLKELASQYNQSIPPFLQKSIHSIVSYTDIGTLRIQPGSVYNPLFDHPLAVSEYNTKYKSLELIDAGIDFNIPIPPLLDPKREISCIIIIDASSSLQGAPELKRAEEYARKHNYPFPHIDYHSINYKLMSIFEDPDPIIPTIIYIPLLKNDDYSPSYNPLDHLNFPDHLNTFNLYYTRSQAQALSGLPEFTVIQHKNQIKNILLNALHKNAMHNNAIHKDTLHKKQRPYTPHLP